MSRRPPHFRHPALPFRDPVIQGLDLVRPKTGRMSFINPFIDSATTIMAMPFSAWTSSRVAWPSPDFLHVGPHRLAGTLGIRLELRDHRLDPGLWAESSCSFS
jgi:hypothetical protein